MFNDNCKHLFLYLKNFSFYHFCHVISWLHTVGLAVSNRSIDFVEDGLDSFWKFKLTLFNFLSQLLNSLHFIFILHVLDHWFLEIAFDHSHSLEEVVNDLLETQFVIVVELSTFNFVFFHIIWFHQFTPLIHIFMFLLEDQNLVPYHWRLVKLIKHFKLHYWFIFWFNDVGSWGWELEIFVQHICIQILKFFIHITKRHSFILFRWLSNNLISFFGSCFGWNILITIFISIFHFLFEVLHVTRRIVLFPWVAALIAHFSYFSNII